MSENTEYRYLVADGQEFGFDRRRSSRCMSKNDNFLLQNHLRR